MQTEVRHTDLRVAGSQTAPDGGMKMKLVGIQQTAGRRSMVSGTTSIAQATELKMSGEADIGQELMALGHISQQDHGIQMAMVGGMKIQLVGIQQTAG